MRRWEPEEIHRFLANRHLSSEQLQTMFDRSKDSLSWKAFSLGLEECRRGAWLPIEVARLYHLWHLRLPDIALALRTRSTQQIATKLQRMGLNEDGGTDRAGYRRVAGILGAHPPLKIRELSEPNDSFRIEELPCSRCGSTAQSLDRSNAALLLFSASVGDYSRVQLDELKLLIEKSLQRLDQIEFKEWDGTGGRLDLGDGPSGEARLAYGKDERLARMGKEEEEL